MTSIERIIRSKSRILEIYSERAVIHNSLGEKETRAVVARAEPDFGEEHRAEKNDEEEIPVRAGRGSENALSLH